MDNQSFVIFYKLGVKVSLFLSLFLMSSGLVKSQTCSGSLGDPVINIDFGRGATERGNSLGNNTNYFYEGIDSPNDGDYAIAKTTFGMNGGWYQIQNHTPNDPDGYMMVVNAADNPGIFYETATTIELCPNTTYEFAAWIVNILKYDGKKPNITFYILTPDNDIIKSFNTGDIEDRDPTWKQYGFLFSTTTTSNIKIRIVNNGPGGDGNDIALDDITFRACGAKISASILNNVNNSEQNICEGTSASFDFSATIEGSPTLSFQWQQNRDNTGWTDIDGETSANMSVDLPNAEKGIYRYRLSAAEPGNFNSALCRIASSALTVNVNPIPVPVASSNSTVCVGHSIALNVNFFNGSYAWTGPNGFTSSEKSPIISNASLEMAGVYNLTVTSAAGCSATTQTTVSIIPATTAAVRSSVLEICEGSSVKLEAFGGTIYKWFPEVGLSATDVPSPTASPSNTTLYTVTISNGACEETKRVNVIVNKKPEAATDGNKTIFEGQYTTLQGTAQGDNIRYYWSPSTGLDDPYKLNPTANPKEDISYTFNVISNSGCGFAIARTFVRVYQTVRVPNSFSPNGDNINDTWQIDKIHTYENPRVKIMNRYGTSIFDSTGYSKSWDGKYKNEDVPIGVYFYIITLHNDLKPLTGSLTVIR